MPQPVRFIPIDALKISDRAPDARVYDQHLETVAKLKELFAKPLHVAALSSFRSTSGTPQSYMLAVRELIRHAIHANNVFDFGVIDNEAIAKWERRAAEEPIKELPWSGTALFLMTHPNEITSDRSLSMYVIHNEPGELLIAELMFIAASETMLVYQGFLTDLPLGGDWNVTITGYSDGPTTESVNSTLPPVVMGTAFLREQTSKLMS